MNRRMLILLPAVAFLTAVWACAPSPSTGPVTAEREITDTQLLQLAQSALSAKAYEDAADLCLNILARHPQSPVVPRALLLLGMSRAALEDLEGAQEALDRLVTEYPDHPAALDGQIERLRVYLLAEHYRKVILEAPLLLEQVSAPERLFLLHLVLGDAHAAMGAAADAFDAYLWAREQARGDQLDGVKERMRAVSTLLKGDEIDLILAQPLDSWTRGLLLFQLGIVRAGEGAYDEAVWYFSKFVEDFPYHDNVSVAYELIEQLADSIAFDQYAVGCLLPLSGPYRLFGQRALDGIEMAFAELAKVEGELPVRLIIRDTGSDPDRAARTMADFLEMKVAAVIGPIATAEAAAGVAQEAGIPIMTLSQREGIAETGRFVFRNFITPRMQAAAIADYAIHRAHMKRFAILYPDETYGRTFMNVFWDEVERRGGQVVGVEAYTTDQTDFETPIRKLVGLHYPVPTDLAQRDLPLTLLGNRGLDFLKARAEAEEADAEEEVTRGRSRSLRKMRTTGLGIAPGEALPIVDFEGLFIPDSPGKAGLIAPQLVYHDVNGVALFGTNLWQSGKLMEMAGEFVQGAVFPAGFYTESRRSDVNRFVQRFLAVYGREPDFIEAIAYDAAGVMLATVLSPDAWLRSGIRYRLMTMDGFEGVTGYTRFNSAGDAEKAPFLLQVRKDAFFEMDLSEPVRWSAEADGMPMPPPPVWKGP